MFSSFQLNSISAHSHLNAQQGCLNRTAQVMNKNYKLSFHITYSDHIFFKIRQNLQTKYKTSQTLKLGKTEFVPPGLVTQYTVK